MSVALLKPGREKAILEGHPWIFSRAIQSVDFAQGGDLTGETVDIFRSGGEFLARGAYSPRSQIRIRIWTRDQDTAIDKAFFHSRLAAAIKLREDLYQLSKTNAFRLVNGESDGLPGLIVDRFSDSLVIQCLTSGIEKWRETLVDMLVDLTRCKRIYERSDVDVRKLEGLEERKGIVFGPEPPDRIEIEENGVKYLVDIRGGQKTGFYLDQRENRQLIRRLADKRTVLDCFAYTGGFTIAAILGGAWRVIAVDSSEAALELARENFALNSIPANSVDLKRADVFQLLREYRDRGLTFDLIVLDPPKYAPTASQAQRAARAYKDINLLALKLLNPGGYLVTFSCSGGIGEGLFQQIIAGAARDAKIHAKILTRLTQAADHPVALNFPEGAYLKGFLISV